MKGQPACVVRLHSLQTCFEPVPASPCQLTEKSVHLWFGQLQKITLPASPLSYLHEHQLQEVRSIRNPERKEIVLRIHACVNAILSFYTGLAACQHVFKKNASGKPFLKEPDNLHFNLSHSSDAFLLALARHPVGVDMERTDRKIPELMAIIRRYYSAEEQKIVSMSSRPETDFLKIWTRKEAIIKAVGTGLHENLNQINTQTDGAAETDINKGWHVYSGQMEDYLFSLAIACAVETIRCFLASDIF